jgi:hypothetical protein
VPNIESYVKPIPEWQYRDSYLATSEYFSAGNFIIFVVLLKLAYFGCTALLFH